MNTRAWLKKVSLSIDERGAALITGLLLVLVLTVLSIAAMMSTATELKIAANDRSSKQIFYLAEAGLEDARSRLQAGVSPSPIYDSQSSNPNWTAFIGTAEKAAWKGYDSTYQIITLFQRNTIIHNVSLALLGLSPLRWNPLIDLKRQVHIVEQARAALDQVGLGHIA